MPIKNKKKYKEYEIVVTTTTTVYVAATSDAEAKRLAKKEALKIEPDDIIADISSWSYHED